MIGGGAVGVGRSWKIWGRILQKSPVGVDSETGALREDGSLQSLGQTGVLWGLDEFWFCG